MKHLTNIHVTITDQDGVVLSATEIDVDEWERVMNARYKTEAEVARVIQVLNNIGQPVAKKLYELLTTALKFRAPHKLN